MGIVSKPTTKASRKGHVRVYGDDRHVNAACCNCQRCWARRSAEPTRVWLAAGVDPATGPDSYTIHKVR